jgi:lipopolysaccharide transport system ATP-binding protein
MSSSDLALSVRGVGKAYSIRHEIAPPTRLGEVITDRMRHPFRRSQREIFWALKDVSFDVPRGEVIGLIGRNGAGKSTLLKILSRITEMTEGEADLYGRVGSLLEVGTGFHQELTGRENIFLNGAILGMRRAEIRDLFDEIVEFAGVEQFLDTPVKRYSSGMYVRLAFAVAAHLRSEILIVDEVLAVGDGEFQRKCLGKMRDVATGGRTVLLVSHNMAAVSSLCSRGILLRAGRVICCGSIEEAVAHYADGDGRVLVSNLRGRRDRVGHGEVRAVGLLVKNAGGEVVRAVKPYEPFSVVVEYEAVRDVAEVGVSLDLEAMDGTRIATLYSGFRNETFVVREGQGSFVCRVSGLPVRPETYSLNVSVSGHHILHDSVRQAAFLEVAPVDVFGTGRLPDRTQGPLLVDYHWLIPDAGPAINPIL